MARSQTVDLDFGGVARATGLLDGVAAQDAATVAQLNAAIEGISWKDSVRVATTANITLSGPGSTIDGVTMATNDRVLVKDQSTQSQNGIYIWNGSAVAMTRATDASTSAELEQAVTTVEEGTSAGTSFRQTQVNFTLDSGNVIWTSFGVSSPVATESTAGIAEIATQGETDTGTDDARIVTPLKLANWSGRKLKFSQTIGDGSATTFNIDHNFGTRDVTVAVYRNSGSYDTVIADETRPTTNRVTVGFAVAPSSNAFRVVVLG